MRGRFLLYYPGDLYQKLKNWLHFASGKGFRIERIVGGGPKISSCPAGEFRLRYFSTPRGKLHNQPNIRSKRRLGGKEGHMSARDPEDRSLPELIESCRHQSRPANRGAAAGCCLELFRRAIVEEEPQAWEFIQEQYRRLVSSWVQRGAAGPLSLEDREDLIQDCYLKFWRTIGRRPELFQEKFDHIGSILRYLQQCATSACIDFQRRESRLQITEKSLFESSEELTNRDDFAEVAESRQERALQVERVRAWIESEIKSEKERLILHHSFQDGWSPKKIFSQYSEKFSNVEEVRKVKIRVMKRAKRNFRE